MAKISEGLQMVIGMDGKRAVCNNTGLGNYSRYAVNIMSLAYPSAQFRLYSPVERESDRLAPLLERENVALVTPKLRFDNGLSRAFWRTVDLPLDLSRDEVTLYHGLSNELPLTIGKICPSVVTIHDLIWRRVPAGYKAPDRAIYDFKYRRSARIATRVIAISERTKADLIEDYHIDPEKIDVIYQGVDPIFSLDIGTEKKFEVRARYSLPPRYILAVGTIELRKNQALAVEALAELPEDVELILVGRPNGSYWNELKRLIVRLHLEHRVRRLENVPFADLPALYADSVFASYTSRYEGFGLPVVEALTAATPVIAATGSCLEEAGGDGAVYVDPDSAEQYVEAARRIIDDVAWRDRLIRLGRRHVRKFSAENFARETMACYNRAILNF